MAKQLNNNITQTEREHLQLSTEGQAPRDSGISEQGSFHRTGSLGQTHGL